MSAKHPVVDSTKLTKTYKVGKSGARVRGSWRLLLLACWLLGWKGDLNGSVSGGRTYAGQMGRWLVYLSGGPPAFPPWSKTARHLWRNIRGPKHWEQAIDAHGITGRTGLIAKAKQLGVQLHTPVPGEPWHVEAVEKFDARAVYGKAKRIVARRKKARSRR